MKQFVVGDVMGISIHALLAESDLNAHLYYHSRGLFLSTLSLRRATIKGKPAPPVVSISIHALLAESDLPYAKKFGFCDLISIHALLAESDFKITVK